jgi:formamidopyrimidine-DNA glycosylase
MPEFPEVYTITSDLNKILKKSVIKRITPIDDYRLLPSTEKFVKTLEGALIEEVEQIAKNIIIKTNFGYLNIHLAMTGQLLAKKSAKALKWERVTFEIENHEKTFFLAFRDARMFGKVKLLNQMEYLELQKKYGPEPLSPELTPKKFAEILQTKDTKIKNLLMEQDKIAGLGNIYSTEALFLAGIQPETRTKNLSREQADSLLESIKKVVSDSILHRGSTLDDEMFLDVFGKKGQNQDYLRIYNKKTCPNCNAKVEMVKISGRSSYYCPNCQPKINPKGIFFPNK